jgi:hypothetical protein
MLALPHTLEAPGTPERALSLRAPSSGVATPVTALAATPAAATVDAPASPLRSLAMPEPEREYPTPEIPPHAVHMATKPAAEERAAAVAAATASAVERLSAESYTGDDSLAASVSWVATRLSSTMPHVAGFPKNADPREQMSAPAATTAAAGPVRLA